MSLGDFFSSLASRVVREAVQDATKRGLADHANGGDLAPTSVHFGPPVLTLCTIVTAALCLTFAWLVFHPIALSWDGRIAWLVISGGIAVAALLALWDAAARRIDWNETSVRFRAWNSERIVPWADIVGIAENAYPPHARIAFRDGKGFAIYETMNGSRYFKRLIEGQLAPQQPDGGKRQRRRQQRKTRRK